MTGSTIKVTVLASQRETTPDLTVRNRQQTLPIAFAELGNTRRHGPCADERRTVTTVVATS